jgi:hypothetical protein
LNVTINDNNEIVYIIDSATFAEAENIQDILNFDNTTSVLNTNVQEILPEVSITSVEVEDDITTDISIVVDVTDASENLNKATKEIEEKLED